MPVYKKFNVGKSPPRVTKHPPNGVPRIRKQALAIHRTIVHRNLYGMASNIFVYPTCANSPQPPRRQLGVRIIDLSLFPRFISIAPPPSDRPWNMRNQGARGPLVRLVRLIRLIRTFSNERSHTACSQGHQPHLRVPPGISAPRFAPARQPSRVERHFECHENPRNRIE